eukprot:scaffold218675_cov40-Tisochrysis_lutea.AAC.1
MAYMFASTPSFNQPLNWDTSVVTNMAYMFGSSSSFNDPSISNWDTSHVTNMLATFFRTSFNHPLNWDTSNVRTMENMFYESDFKQPLKWDTHKLTRMNGMFTRATQFNQPLAWDVCAPGVGFQECFRKHCIEYPKQVLHPQHMESAVHIVEPLRGGTDCRDGRGVCTVLGTALRRLAFI